MVKVLKVIGDFYNVFNLEEDYFESWKKGKEKELMVKYENTYVGDDNVYEFIVFVYEEEVIIYVKEGEDVEVDVLIKRLYMFDKEVLEIEYDFDYRLCESILLD